MYYLTISDAKVKEKTGKTWKEWFSILDAWNARQRGHVASRYTLSPWWSQVVNIRVIV